MFVATRSVTVRLDDEAQRALASLERPGRTRSEIVRAALVKAARDRDELIAEVERLANDPENLREIAEVQALLDEISDPW